MLEFDCVSVSDKEILDLGNVKIQLRKLQL